MRTPEAAGRAGAPGLAGRDLLSLRGVIRATVGAVGFCRGGGCVLHLAAADPRVRAGVAFHGVIHGKLPAWALAASSTRASRRSISAPCAAAIREESGITSDLRLCPANHAFSHHGRPVHDTGPRHRSAARTVPFLPERRA